MVAFATAPASMSTEEFLAWEPGDGRMWQLVDGEPRIIALSTPLHALLHAELAGVIGNHLKARNRRCHVFITPGVVPRVLSSGDVRVPDMAVTCKGGPIEPTVLTEPLLLAEILSPSNGAETWANVWAYTTIPSVREIVVLRTASVRADVLRRQADGTWPGEPERVEAGDLVLDSIGLRVPLPELYEDTGLAP